MSSTTLLYTSAARARRKQVFAAISEEIVTDFLAMAERRIENRCDRLFSRASRVEYYDGRNKPYFYLRHSPVVSLDALAVIDANGDEDTIDVSGSDADVVLDTDTGKVSFGPDNTSIYATFPITYPRNIKATYTAGWTNQNADDDFQEAVILQAMILYASTSLNMNAGLGSQRIGTGSKTRINEAQVKVWRENLNSLLERFMYWEG
jgi:hypothetical protein